MKATQAANDIPEVDSLDGMNFSVEMETGTGKAYVYLRTIFELSRRFGFQKFIIVYVDGRCRPNRDGVPVDPTGDKCERGTFYMDAPLGGPAQMETNMLELMDYVDATYRTKAAEMVEVIK